MKSQWFLFSLVALTLFASGPQEELRADPPKDGAPAFFAFDNGVGRDVGMKPEEQARILADLGYQGIGYTGVKNISEMLAALDARGLRMFSTYLKVDLAPGAEPYDPDLPKAIELFKPHTTALWVHLHGGKASSDEFGRSGGRRSARDLRTWPRSPGSRWVLYPHVGFYVSNNADALRVVKKVDRKNVGTSFNLCHFSKQQERVRNGTE